MTQDPGELIALLRRLAGRRTVARLVILFERVWPAVWPPLGVIGAFAVIALLDLPALLPPLLHLAVLLGAAIATFILLVRGLRAVRLPDDGAADRRLEQSSGLRHRPLGVLMDRPARHDTVGAAIWQVHLARAVQQVHRLRVGPPHPGLARRDRHALRGALVVALIAALAIAGEDAPARLAYALEPTLPRPPGPPATELQAWITPPAYTHLAPMFLHQSGGAISVPSGSQLTVSVTGGTGQPSLSLDGHSTDFRALTEGSFQAERTLTQGGHLAVRRSGSELAGWNITVLTDQPPTVAWGENPGRSGTSQQTRLPWEVSDDYGVASLQAELRLQERPDAQPLAVAIPLPGGTPKAAHGVSQQDLTAHPWAGLPVIARLIARDEARQQATTPDVTFVLPERPFQIPAARALIAIRKGLSLHPDDRDSALGGLDALIMQPSLFGTDSGAFINLGALYYLLERDHGGAAVPAAQERLWQLALHMEEGQTEQTARALEQAREAAREALDKAIREPNDANRAELERRLQALEKAIREHMQALLEEARRNHQELPFDPNRQHLTDRDLQRQAEAAREAAREGRMQEAQRRMAQLERMLDQLRSARAGQNKGAQQRSAQRQRGKQQMGALQDMIGRQGGLLDHAQGRAGDETGPRGGKPPTEAADPDAQRDADRRVQQALRRALGELMQQFTDLTGDVPPSLSEADTSMREAGQQLAMGNDKAAGAAEQKAIEALQKGGREMGQAMANQFGPGREGEESELDDTGSEGQSGYSMQDGEGEITGNGTLPGPPGRADSRRDPLGRRYGQGNSGADETNDVIVPEERERQRTQAIQEELRRRGAERERPQVELDYIERLLKRF